MYTNAKAKIFRLLTELLSITCIIAIPASCSTGSNEDEDDPKTSNDDACYISSCYFSNLRIPHVVKASDGVTDSTYYTTYVPFNKYMTIDQRTLTIQNRDSVSRGTDLSKVPLVIQYTGSFIEWRKTDAFDDDEWTTFNSGDSLDLRKPLRMKITAMNGHSRIYTITVNMHEQDGDELSWNKMPVPAGLSGSKPMRMAATKNGVVALVNDGGSIAVYTHGLSNTGEWVMQSCPSLPDKTDVMTLVEGLDALYVNTTDGQIYISTDGIQWSLVDTREGVRLLGTSEYFLYALRNGNLESTRTDQSAWEWNTESLDDRKDLVPCEDIAFVHYEQNFAQHRAVLIGYSPDEDNHFPMDAIVWSKAWSHFSSEGKAQLIVNEKGENWMMYSRTWDDLWQMPMLENMQVVSYDDKLMAIGGKNPYTEESLEGVYVSSDNGLTWRITGEINLPEDLGDGNSICWIVDNDDFLWLAVDGKIFRGRLNRLGFKR